jgi:hypothetical protein
METYKKTPIEKLIRTPPSQDDPGRRENRAGHVTQVFVDGKWMNVKGNLELFVKRERKKFTTMRIKLLFNIGKLQRGKTHELSAAESTFRLLTGDVFTKTLKQLAEQRANSLKQTKPPVESGITHYPQTAAIRELITTRKLAHSSDVKFWARMLMISNSSMRPGKEIATQLSRAIQTQSADEKTTVPPPLILISPEHNQHTITVHQPTSKVQPFYWFINPHMDGRYYAFTPPPGFEFTQATVWATRNAKVNCHVPSLHQNPSEKWDFKKKEYIGYKQQEIEMAKLQLQFRKDSGLLIVEVNNSRGAKDFSVQASFRKRELISPYQKPAN